jgi:PAS domain S-box-containing protein
MAPSSGSLIVDMKPMRLRKIGGGWLKASFANQITVFVLSLTLGVSLLIGAASYFALRAQIEAATASGLATQTHLIERRLSHFINLASAELETLSRNSFLSNGLVDSSGRDGYLLPFLRDHRLSIPGREGVSLTLYDFAGKPLIQVRPDAAIAADADVVGQTIAMGRPQVRISTQGNETYLKLVQPIHFPPTQSVEGALAVRIRLAPLLANTGIALAEGQFLQLHTADAVLAQVGATQQVAIRVERALKLDAPLDTLALRLTLDSSTRDVHGPLDRLTLIYVVGLLLFLPLVGWAARQGARRLVAPLGQLGATADAIASTGVISLPPQVGAPNEVGRLADAFSRMLARVGATQTELNKQTAGLLASEEFLQSVLDSALDAFIRINAQGQVTDWNLQAEQMFGYSRADALGKQLESLIIPPSFQEAHRRGLAHFLKTGEGPVLGKLIEVTAIRANGRELPVEIAIAVSRSGNILSFNAFMRDISVRKQAQEEILRLNADLEERVRQRTAQLQAVNQELEAFSYSVSHDLRTPLSTIDGYSDLLGKEFLSNEASERSKHFLSRIRAGVGHMGELIDALLSLAQVSRSSLRWESVDLSAIAETVLSGYREREPGRLSELAIQPGLVAHGDPGLLRQVLDNLMGNAWKYSSKQQQTVVSFRRDMGSDGAWVYAVQDNGAGFDMAHADKLFGAFQRLHSAVEFEGTGIGLATVYRIITRHGGRVWAKSAPGRGATFYFTLGDAAPAGAG